MNDIKIKVKAIIFDMDGTIIKTDHVWEDVTTKILQKIGVFEIPAEKQAFYDSLTGMGLRDASTALKREFNLLESVDEIIAQKIAIANSHFVNKVEYIEGFELFHQKLQKNLIPTSIATNAHPINLHEIVKTMKFEQFFGTNIYSMADVNFKAKPDPALFLFTANMLGAKPEECVVFEDSIHGFNAAQAAGMKCIAVKNKKNELLLHKVNHAIDSYHEAEDALRKI